MKKYVDKDALQDFATKLTDKYKTIFSSPLVASTVADMTDEEKVYVYVGSETGYTNGNWYYYNGSAWVSGGIYNSTAFETDDTLSGIGKAADAKATGDAINEVTETIGDLSDLDTTNKTNIVAAINEAAQSGGSGSGITADIKAALLQIAQKVAYIDEDGQDYYDALYDALYPPVNLTSISCVYTQSGTVYDTDSLDSLKSDLVVTAHYSNGTSETITNYTLSGTLAEGTSTVTVSYGGKTATFNVIVTVIPPEYPKTLTESSPGVGFGTLDISSASATIPYVSHPEWNNRFHCIGDNTGYPVTYGKSYKVTISGVAGTECIAPRCFNAAGKTQLENTQNVTGTNANEPLGNWLTVDANKSFTFTPTLINGTEPVCMWLNFRKDANNNSWTNVSQMVPITIEELTGE